MPGNKADDTLFLASVYKVDILTPSPTPPLKGGAKLLPSPLRGEGKGEGVIQSIHTLFTCGVF